MEDLLGYAVLAFVIVVSAWLSWMTIRFDRSGSLMDGMIRTTFLQGKRKRYLQILSVEGSAIILCALVWALTRVGIVPELYGNLVVGGFLLVALSSVASVTFLGLSTTPLSEEEKSQIRREAPDFMHSLAFIPG